MGKQLFSLAVWLSWNELLSNSHQKLPGVCEDLELYRTMCNIYKEGIMAEPRNKNKRALTSWPLRAAACRPPPCAFLLFSISSVTARTCKTSSNPPLNWPRGTCQTTSVAFSPLTDAANTAAAFTDTLQSAQYTFPCLYHIVHLIIPHYGHATCQKCVH